MNFNSNFSSLGLGRLGFQVSILNLIHKLTLKLEFELEKHPLKSQVRFVYYNRALIALLNIQNKTKELIV